MTSRCGGFDIPPGSTFEEALRIWRGEIDLARAACASRALDDAVPFLDGRVTVRWIHTHMIGEYARHCGHADLVRERIDGVTGV